MPQRCRNSKMNDIEQLIHNLQRVSTPLDQNEGAGIPDTQVLDVQKSQLKFAFFTSFHNLEPLMGEELLKEVPKLKEWPHFSGQGEYDHIEFIRGIDMIKEDFELPGSFVTEIFNTLFTRSAHGWYINDRHMDTKVCLGGKPKLSTNWPIMLVDLRLKQPLNLLSLILKKTKLYHVFAKKKDRLTALNPAMSEFMIHRKILRKCGGESEHPIKSRTTDQFSEKILLIDWKK
ncbi:hypothetical protein O181_034177 [Austropuccinia psidii MF-1]|uniref:Uncharacterized protein n=1 Tax=Austropuccinia psidii MF-1 TaxID=1389203 RepID=A0A9Q3D635_9BASI|nr:hypothetical protein [Austropuccinia psidii MF-1]